MKPETREEKRAGELKFEARNREGGWSRRKQPGKSWFCKDYEGRSADVTFVAVKRLKEERTQGGDLQVRKSSTKNLFPILAGSIIVVFNCQGPLDTLIFVGSGMVTRKIGQSVSDLPAPSASETVMKSKDLSSIEQSTEETDSSISMLFDMLGTDISLSFCIEHSGIASALLNLQPELSPTENLEPRLLENAKANSYDSVFYMQHLQHMCFESEERARILLHNVSALLKPGGYFFGITPDSSTIWTKYQKIVEAFHNRSGSMKPGLVPTCIRSESYMITFKVEEEKYVNDFTSPVAKFC